MSGEKRESEEGKELEASRLSTSNLDSASFKSRLLLKTTIGWEGTRSREAQRFRRHSSDTTPPTPQGLAWFQQQENSWQISASSMCFHLLGSFTTDLVCFKLRISGEFPYQKEMPAAYLSLTFIQYSSSLHERESLSSGSCHHILGCSSHYMKLCFIAPQWASLPQTDCWTLPQTSVKSTTTSSTKR